LTPRIKKIDIASVVIPKF